VEDLRSIFVRKTWRAC